MSAYEGWFQFLDTDRDGKISGAQVADFFRRSNLDDGTLREIWGQAAGNVGEMTEIQFLLAMKLVALTQVNDGHFSQAIAYPVLVGSGSPVPQAKIRGFTIQEWQKPATSDNSASYNANQVQSTSTNAPSSYSSLQTSTPRMNAMSGHHSPRETVRTSGQSTSILSSAETTTTTPVFRLDSWCTNSTHQNSDGCKSAASSTKATSSRKLEINNREELNFCSAGGTFKTKEGQFSPGLQSFSPEDLRKATNGYAKHLGGGGYGEVYKGSINHVPVAVKILGEDVMQGCKEYGREVALLGTMRHPHIVTLYGKCDKVGALVYELLPGGNLEERLQASPLPWESRLRIAKEVALGLYYLHNCPSPIVHRDLKPANILLDTNLTAKVGDMGLSRIMDPTSRASTVAGGVKGTFHFIAPEYENTGVYTTLCDVYSFGVILLQLLTFRPANLVREEVREALRLNTLESVIDRRSGTGTWPEEILQTVTKLGYRCCHSQSNVRPQMSEVVDSLKEMHDLSIALGASTPNSGADGMDHILRCPLSKRQLQDPVIADDGHTYERKAIQQWLNEGQRRSPLTNVPISTRLISNNIAKTIIALHAKSQESRRR